MIWKPKIDIDIGNSGDRNEDVGLDGFGKFFGGVIFVYDGIDALEAFEDFCPGDWYATAASSNNNDAIFDELQDGLFFDNIDRFWRGYNTTPATASMSAGRRVPSMSTWVSFQDPRKASSDSAATGAGFTAAAAGSRVKTPIVPPPMCLPRRQPGRKQAADGGNGNAPQHQEQLGQVGLQIRKNAGEQRLCHLWRLLLFLLRQVMAAAHAASGSRHYSFRQACSMAFCSSLSGWVSGS